MQRRMKMNHRRSLESVGTTSKPGRVVDPGSALKTPAYCQSGVRGKGGVSACQAWVRNLGTCRRDAKKESQAEAPLGFEYRSMAQGRMIPYELGRSCNGSGAKGINDPAEGHGTTSNGRTP